MMTRKNVLILGAIILLVIVLALPLRGALASFAKSSAVRQSPILAPVAGIFEEECDNGANGAAQDVETNEAAEANEGAEPDCATPAANVETNGAADAETNDDADVETNDDQGSPDTDNIQDPGNQDGEAPDVITTPAN